MQQCNSLTIENLRREMVDSEAQERASVGAMAKGEPMVQPEAAAAETERPVQETAPPKRNKRYAELPSFSAGLPLRDLSPKVLDALAAQPVGDVVLHNGKPCRIRHSRKGGVCIEPHSKATLRGVVFRACRIIGGKGDEVREVVPSDALIEDLLSLPCYPEDIQRVKCVSEMPLILADGRVLTEPGLDWASGIYVWPEARLRGIEVAENPSEADVRYSLEVLDDIVVDIPFVDRASRANYLAIWLTVVVIHAVDGNVPSLVTKAPQQGSGKGLLSSILAMTAKGQEAASQVLSNSDEELRKVLTSCLRRGMPIIAFDNITHVVNHPSLASFLTSTVWQDRILGHTRIEEFDNNTVVILNGNNIALGGDCARRVVWCGLDPGCSRPWERTGFRHSPLLTYVKKRRPEIVKALLTIARSWFAAGCPSYDVPTMGSFESWCRTVGNILAHAGVDGFLDNRYAAYEQIDEEASEFTAFLRQWLAEIGPDPVAARDIVAKLDPDDLPSGVMPGQSGHGSVVKRLAKTLSRYEKRRFGDDNIHVVATNGNKNTKRWQVRCDPTS